MCGYFSPFWDLKVSVFYSWARILDFLSTFVTLHGQVCVFITCAHVLDCDCFKYFHCTIVGPVTNHSRSVNE